MTMNKSMQLIKLFLALIIFTGCAPLQGNVHLLRVDDDKKTLHGPWHKIEENKHKIIPVAGEIPDPNMQDAFSVVFDQAYFKYLLDLTDSNEVIVIFTFTNGHDVDNKIVKIIGPMERMRDGSFANWLGKVAYGPTRFDGNVLTVEIDVLEYDDMEMSQSAAFLDFIGTAVSTFNLADPVTAAEIDVAKEIAKTLLSLNQNDPVLNINFDIVPYQESHWHNGNKPKTIPLMAGDYAIIKEEQKSMMNTPFLKTYNLLKGSKLDWIYALVTLPADLIALPFVTLNLLVADIPSRSSLSPLVVNAKDKNYQDNGHICFEDSGKRLVFALPNKDCPDVDNDEDTDSKVTEEIKKLNKQIKENTVKIEANKEASDKHNIEHLVIMPKKETDKNQYKKSGKSDLEHLNFYQNKTWITFSIERGGDWRKTTLKEDMLKTERELAASMKDMSLDNVFKESKVESAIKSLNDIKEKEKELTEMFGFRVVVPVKGKISIADLKAGAITLEIGHPTGLTINSIELFEYDDEGNKTGSKSKVIIPKTSNASSSTFTLDNTNTPTPAVTDPPAVVAKTLDHTKKHYMHLNYTNKSKSTNHTVKIEVDIVK